MKTDDILGIVFVGITRMLMDDIWYPSLNNDYLMIMLRDWIDARFVETGFVVNLRSTALSMAQGMFIYHKAYLSMNNGVTAFGIVFLLSGWALSKWARFTLGRHATFNTGVVKDQRMVMDGPYALMVHPQWTGDFLAATGVYLIFVDSFSINILLGFLNVVIYVAKTRDETSLLKQHVPGYYEYFISRFSV